MRNWWRKILEKILWSRAQYVLNKFKPLVVGVTGSTGKTTTKEAIYQVLREKYLVSRNEGNYNNELGVPLAIIRMKKPENVLSWLWFFWQSRQEVRGMTNYPACLVLELAADKMGDIKHLCDLVKPSIGVVTNVGESHLEFFGSLRNTAKEKRSVVECLPKNGRAIINNDDELVLAMQKRTKAKVLTYGFNKGAMVNALNVRIDEDKTSYKLVYNGSVVPVSLKLIGFPAVRASLAAVAVGLSMDMDILQVVNGLSKWQALPGRMSPIKGKRKMMIIDDSYNASRDSMVEAFESIKNMMTVKRRKVAILGSMWELGKATVESHTEVGRRASRLFDVLLLVEEHASIMFQAAVAERKSDEGIFVYKNTSDLLEDVDVKLFDGDLVLVKGSQARNRLEKVVKHLMANPKDADKVLVRQGKEWQNK